MKNAELLATLGKGRERIAKGWCVERFAINKWGRGCDPNDPNAVAWCARGAVGITTSWGLKDSPAEIALAMALDPRYIIGGQSGNSVALFNNSHSQSDVLALFDRAIELVKKSAPQPISVLVANLMKGLENVPSVDLDSDIASPEYLYSGKEIRNECVRECYYET